MGSYEFLAGSYDAFTSDVNYAKWREYIEWHFSRLDRPVHAVLDLACGTGSLTRELALRGYEVIGVDLSPEMLALAEEKCRDLEPTPRFFCQPMEKLHLPDTVDAVVCCLDSVNYVLKPEKLQGAFRRVWEALEPGGLFLFDVDTPEKLAGMDGQIFLDETEEEFIVWRGQYRRRICSFWMDIFRRKGQVWERGGELHKEFAYTMNELEDYLRWAGFQQIKRYGELKRCGPKEGEQRIFFAAQKEE